jgi:hypothetical protein
MELIDIFWLVEATNPSSCKLGRFSLGLFGFCRGAKARDISIIILMPQVPQVEKVLDLWTQNDFLSYFGQ